MPVIPSTAIPSAVSSSTVNSIAVKFKTFYFKKVSQLLVFTLGLGFSVLSHAAPTFSLAFSPTTIGITSTSTLTYTINNSADPTAITDVAFSNTLPANLLIANPSRASTTCVGGLLTATPGTDTLTFSDYRLSAQTSCKLSVDVTSAAPGAYVNTTGTLTTNDGNVSTANATLTVDGARPGMSMAFVPSTINQGAVSKLTFTVDNSLNGSDVDLLLFSTNTLPVGLVVSDQPEAVTTCTGGASASEVVAIAGANSIAFSRGFTASGASCTISVNITAAPAGKYVHVGNSLSRNGSNPSGGSSALLTVINPFLNANFPATVALGTSVDLTYTLTNSDRDNTATDITFTNDLNATLSGLTATILPASGFCGTGSTITGSSTITVAGANLASGASCSFTLTVLIPANAANGTYTNTTSTVNLTLGSATTKPALSHNLVVNNAPQVSMTFIDDPVTAGDSVTVRFVVTNVDAAASVSGLGFTMEYNTPYSGMEVQTLPNANSCGIGSTFTSFVDPGVGFVQMADASLTAGTNCTFDVVLALPAGGTTGSFLYTTSAITGTIASTAVTGNSASDTLVVLAAPRLSIELPEDSAAPGETVTANFTLEYTENATADISGIGFTVDLNNALSGLTMSSPTANDICGTGSSVSGTSALTFTGGSLAATEQCTFSVSLLIPSGATPQQYSLVSSAVTGTVAAQSVSASAAYDTQTVTGLTLSKLFVTSQVAAGDSVTMRYTITNSANALAASDMQFTDNLHQSLPSLSAISLPSTPCGVGSQVAGSTSLTFSSGLLAPGDTCTFDVTALVPSSATAGVYNIQTSEISATVNGNNTSTPSAPSTLFVDALEVFISSTESSPTEAASIPVAIHFTRAVTNFIESDLQITNGTASNFSGSDQAFTVDITPTTFGSVVVTLAANTVDDAVFAGVQNASQTLSLEHVDAPANVAVTVPATALNTVGASYALSGTHTINASQVFLYADDDNNGVADNATALASDTVVNGTWSLSAPLSPQVANNFVVGWEDRVNRVSRVVNVPTITEVTPNFDPVIGGNPTTGVAEDTSYDFTPTMTDANTNDTHLFSITNQPSWANFDTANGALTGTPLNADIGTDSNIVITVTDSSSLSASLAAFNIAISNTNDAPVISGTPATTVVEDAAYSFTPTVSEVDVGDTTTYSISNQPSWANFSASTGVLSGAPANDDIGVDSNIVITATDSSSAADSLAAFSITVSNSNDAPVISGTPGTTVAEDSAYIFTPSSSDVDNGDTATFSISNQPSWASFDTATGVLSGTPVNSDVGITTNIVITVTDTAGANDSLAGFSLSVTNTNDAPTISGTPDTSVSEDAAYSFTPTVNDVDSGDTTTFSISNQPSWASFNPSTGVLSGTPTNDDIGTTSNIVITVTDSASAADSLPAFSLTVSNTNDAPIISGTPSTTVAEDASYSFTPVVNDVDSGDTASFSIVNPPSWASFDAATGALTGTPTNSELGLTSNIVITVVDAASASASLPAFSILVSNTNDAPTISGAPSTAVAEDANYSFTPAVTDVDSGDTTSFSIVNQPSWASFDAATGALTGTPSNSNVGTDSAIVITVTDSASATANLTAFNITVSNTNDAPTISGTPSTAVAEDASYSFTPDVTDVDSGDTSSFSIVNLPSWGSFDAGTGTLTGTPTNSDLGLTSNIVITVVDAASASDSLAAFSILVSNTNDAPVISGTPSATVAEDASYTFTPVVSDVDNDDTTSFSIVNQPSWASFDSNTGALTGTPSNSNVGLASGIVITVTDSGSASDSLAAFSITVSNTNDAPIISGTPSTTVAEDASYSFTPVVNDADSGDTASFSIVNPPSWAIFDAATGALTGSPSNSDIGTTSAIVISVSDSGSASGSLAAFNITVSNTNDAPVISGAPSTSVAEDASYSFTPAVSDVDSGDSHTFSISSQPSWANFDDSTGVLSGTPTNSDVGLTTGIVITVSDAAGATNSLAPFSISVSNTNDALVISGTPTTSIAEDANYSFTPTVSDVDAGDTTTFSITNPPSWTSLDTDSGELSGTPSNSDVGISSNIVISVTDSGGAISSLQAFSITVANTNDSPIISGIPSTSVAEDSAYSFTPNVSDVDNGDSQTFSISNQPSWANFSTSTGELIGTPTNSDNGLTSDIVITVTDSAGATDNLAEFSISVSNTNDAPQISGTPSTAVAEDASYSFAPTVSDVDSDDTASFSITNQPSWARFDSSIGALTGTPSNSDIGVTSNIVITVADSANATDSLAAFSINVSNTNDAPTISGTPSTSVAEDANYNFTPIVSDVDSGDSQTFSVSNQPSWANFSTSTGALSGTPSNTDIGTTNNIVITVTDSASATDSLATFSITVSNTNDAPVISGTPSTSAGEDASYSFTPTVSDEDSGDSKTFSVSNQPSWASFTTSTGELSGIPSNADVGVTSNIVITVTDSGGATDSLAAFSITVSNTNDAPVISGVPSNSVAEDVGYSFTPVVTDVDSGDTQAFTIANLPNWASFNTITGALTGTPSNSDVGLSNNIVISVTDGGGATANLPAFGITVSNINDAPVISGTPMTSVAEDASYSFTPVVSDADSGDTSTFSISNKPAWATFDNATGALTGTPSNSDVGISNNIVISVTDSGAATASLAPFSITVTNTNDAPVISEAPATTVAEDANYSFTPVVSDVDSGDTTLFSITNQPDWASFDVNTGALAGTPTNSDVGLTTGIVITVSDAAGATNSLAAFNILVSNTNDAPQISGTPSTAVDEDTRYSFVPTVLDVDSGDTSVFSVTSPPTWASFDSSTGALTGTPANSDVGFTNNIVITVSDSAGEMASLAAFSITVTNINDAPVISGTPATSVDEGESYGFTPTVNDVDANDNLTFSITNMPSWASFDPVTGTLAGTPSNGHVAIYGGIVITVTDSANASNSLALFSISVSNINDAPEISGTPSGTATEDSAYSFIPTVTDDDVADIETFSIDNKPEWLIFNPSNGGLSGTPSDDDVGIAENIVLTVTDIAGASDSLPAFSINVVNINDEPIAVDDQFFLSENDNGYLLDVLQNDTDEDGDSLTILSFKTSLEGLSIENEQLRFIPRVSFDNVEFEYLVSDGNGGQDIAVVNLSIEAGNTPPPGPVITVPDDVEVNATGLFTRVDLGVATAVDANGNALSVSLSNGNTQFASGKHKVYWQSTDANGNSSVREQEVSVNPLVSFTKGQQAIEGGSISIGIVLSGEAPEYPVVVAYHVNGTADEGDHSLFDGEISLTSTSNVTALDIYEDGVFEETETIILSLSSEVNQGNQNTHIVEIVNGNVAPQMILQITQEGEIRSLIDQSGGTVVITAIVSDANQTDTHSITWQFLYEIDDLDDSDNSFSFDPSELVADQYNISVSVSDNGIPSKNVAATLYFELTNEIPVLTSVDSDGDLVPDDMEGYGDDDGDGIANYLDGISASNVLPSDVAEQEKFLIEGPAGANLRKGRFSAGNENGGGVLSEADVGIQLPPDTEAQNVGGIFDFVIYGLSGIGQTYSIVLPQQQAIPSAAFYRKFLNDEWVTFAVDERNDVYSTEGEQGYCPPPEASVWQAGLTEGHWCVQLSIEDGGPNDDDGLANGTIVDPGGVAVAINGNISPVVVDDSVSMEVGTSIDVNVLENDTDDDGDTLSISSVVADIGLSVINENGELTYTPPAGFVGVDVVVYSVTDANGGSASGALTINIVLPEQTPRTQVVSVSGRSGSGSMSWLTLFFMCLLYLRNLHRGVIRSQVR